MKIYVGGVNAVGKSTLLKEVSERLGYRYIHATTGLMNSFGFEGDYEKLRALRQEERNSKLKEYIENLLSLEKQNFFLDSHYLGLVRGRVDKITGSWLKDFDALVLVSAPLADIWKRIGIDSQIRDRALFPEDTSEIERKNILFKYQDQTSTEFKKLADLHNKPCIEILNEEGTLEKAVQSLVSFIRNLPNS